MYKLTTLKNKLRIVTHRMPNAHGVTSGIFVATGARPNVAYSFEHRDTFTKENGKYQTHNLVNGKLQPTPIVEHIKKAETKIVACLLDRNPGVG